MRRTVGTIAAGLAAPLFAAAQAPPAAPKANDARIGSAIDRGSAWLLSLAKSDKIPVAHKPKDDLTHLELVFYTLLSTGTSERDPGFQKLLQEMLTKDLKRTYCVVLTAMALNKLDPERYQGRIAQCAQFLVDNQCANGQWSYGEPVPLEKATSTTSGEPKRRDVMTPSGRPGTESGPPDGAAAPPPPARRATSTRALRQVPIRQRDHGPAAGDNSNSQFAALGLRACLESGIVIEPKVLEKADAWWKVARNRSGGFNYSTDATSASYGSMTAGALGVLSIYRHYLRRPIQGDKMLEDAAGWLGQHFRPGPNPEASDYLQRYNYFFLYAVERAGALYGTKTFGPHDWYAEGSAWLLSKQEQDGSWNSGDCADTCWALLFLQRATKPLVKVYTQ